MFSFNKKIIFVLIIVLILVYSVFRILSVDSLINDSDNAREDGAENVTEENIKTLIENFGQNLKHVNLLAPREDLINSIEENYSQFVSEELMQQWKYSPRSAPGRISSSPWPERIEITELEKLSENEYRVTGRIVEVTSQEVAQGGIAAVRPIEISIKKIDDKWLIVSITVGRYENFNE